MPSIGFLKSWKDTLQNPRRIKPATRVSHGEEQDSEAEEDTEEEELDIADTDDDIADGECDDDFDDGSKDGGVTGMRYFSIQLDYIKLMSRQGEIVEEGKGVMKGKEREHTSRAGEVELFEPASTLSVFLCRRNINFS